MDHALANLHMQLCTGKQTQLTSLAVLQDDLHLYKAIGAGVQSGLKVAVPAQVAALTDIFHTASLELSVTALPEDHIVSQPTAADMSLLAASDSNTDHPPSQGCQLQGKSGVGEFLKKVQADIRTLGSVVDAAVRIAGTAGNLILNNPVDETVQERVDLLNFNYDSERKQEVCKFDFQQLFEAKDKSKSPKMAQAADAAAVNSGATKDVQGACHSCYAHVGVTLTAQMSIVDRKLQKASIILEGNMVFQAKMDLNITR